MLLSGEGKGPTVGSQYPSLDEKDLLELRAADLIKRCFTGCPRRVATLKVRKGALDALHKGSGALEK